jgi:glucose-6-phosphate isomerase
MIGVSTNGNAVRDFGIAEDRFLPFWDWVGGRYSLWSAVGLPIVLAIGADNFDRLLDGAYAMDRHFLEARPESNLPLTLALIGIWHINFLGAAVHGVFPYDQGLARFHAYLQQLDMESNGKSVDRYGRCLRIATSPIVFGEPGTNGQHSFFQHLHQGTVPVPCDFLLAAEPHVELGAHHGILMANAVAQSEALMRGKTEAEVRADMQARGLERPMVDALVAHRTFAGNRASNTILYRRLDPFTLGRLVALYEHKVFAQGVVWGVNSFDQWGVELGKELAAEVETGLSVGRSSDGHDASTRGLIDRIGKLRSRR